MRLVLVEREKEGNVFCVVGRKGSRGNCLFLLVNKE